MRDDEEKYVRVRRTVPPSRCTWNERDLSKRGDVRIYCRATQREDIQTSVVPDEAKSLGR